MQEAKELFNYFDRDGGGSINIDEFIVAFRVSNMLFSYLSSSISVLPFVNIS